MATDPAHPDRTPIEIGVPSAVTIDCEQCVRRESSACSDCLVSFVLDREPGDAVIIDAEEARALRVLARAGLVPESRFEASAS